MTYRPTTIRLAARHCPRAVDHYERGAEQFRNVFGAGIAAHAVLEHLGGLTGNKGATLTDDEVVAGCDFIAKALMAKGRTFDGVEEPPLPHDDVIEGRDLAQAWALANPLSPSARYELGAGFDEKWNLSGYAKPGTRFRLIFDVLDTHVDAEDEEQTREGLVVRDYKSAWNTDVEELDTVQLKAQALAAYHLVPTFGTPVEYIRQEVVNLRKRGVAARTIWLDDVGKAMLAQWQSDIESTMNALDAMKDANGNRPARPGHGCMGCPWALSCEDGKRFMDAVVGISDRRSLAIAFSVSDARRNALHGLVKESTEDSAPIDIGGALVGSVGVPGREPRRNAAVLAFEAWKRLGGDADGFLAELKIGATALEGIAKRLFKRDRAAQLQLLDSMFTPIMKGKFGVHKQPDPIGLTADDQAFADATEATLAAMGED